MADNITCPSGLSGRIRGMKVREERVLADRKLAKSGGQMDELLGSCWEETLDPGPYSLSEGGKLDWGKVLQGDRFFALLMVRALTYGPEYAFGVGCRNDACRARIDWELDLTKLPVREFSEESRAAFIGGNRFETTLPDAGKRVRFRLLRGEDERKLPALQRAAPDRLLSAVLAYRVLDIDGVDAKAKPPVPRGSHAARRRLPRRRVRPRRLRRRHHHRGGVPRVLHCAGCGPPFRQGLLPPWEGADGEAQGPEHLFPERDAGGMARGHSSSSAGTSTAARGSRLTLSDALELPTSDRDWLLERIGQQRSREAKELEKAAKRTVDDGTQQPRPRASSSPRATSHPAPSRTSSATS